MLFFTDGKFLKKWKTNTKRKKKFPPKLHITNGIRYAAYSAARGSKNTSRAKALCGVFSHPHSSPPQYCVLLYKVGWNVVYLER